MIPSREFNFTLASSLSVAVEKNKSQTLVYTRIFSSSHLEREARNSDERNYSVMNQRRRMPDDDAGYYRALKCKPHAADPRVAVLISGELIRIRVRINRN